MRKFDIVALILVLGVAAGIRLWAPWDDVLGGTRVNFLETDAWYHVRLAQNQVRNFPHRVTVDPYVAPNGQYVAVAPLLDTIIATAVFVTQGRDASVAYIERVAALVPAVVGVLAVAAVWALATFAFDRRAGLIAGLLAAVLPGHFLDRTLVGFVDHHALEVLLSIGTLAAFAYGSGIAAGVGLGLYLLSWASGSYLVAILTLWIALAALISPADTAKAAARSAAIAAGIALLMVIAFQDPGLYRYNTQLAALAVFLVASLAVMFLAARMALVMGVLAAAGAVIVAGAWMLAPDLVGQIATDVGRFRPDPTRMAVLEARPLFMYPGNWTWEQPWTFFRSGFYVGAVAVMGLTISLWRSRPSTPLGAGLSLSNGRRADHVLIVCFTIANYIATIGQNRFGYYLVPATAVVISWLAVVVLDWGGVPHAGNPSPKVRARVPFQRELAVIIVAGVMVAPNLVPAVVTTTRVGGMPEYWFSAMQWLRTETPEPFDSPDYYLARYSEPTRSASYTVMNWWDQGYWIVQTARRVPISNPTQNNAPAAAKFLTATNEADAIARLEADRARYVMVDWELPFREGPAGSLAGRFQNLADWAGIPTSRFYSLCFSRQNESDPWQPTWVFREPYYQSMAYRLMVLGGAATAPMNSTWVVELRHRVDVNGGPFCEVANRWQYSQAEDAKASAAQRGPTFEAVGLTAWQPAFPAPAITGLKVVSEFRDGAQKPNESPMVRIFERVGQ